MSKGSFLGGLIVGAAATLVGSYLLNTEEGKQLSRKVKNQVDNLKDELKSKLGNLDGNKNNDDNTSSTEKNEL